MTTFRFIDTCTHEEIVMIRDCADSAWADLCNHYGTGYVFENIEEI